MGFKSGNLVMVSIAGLEVSGEEERFLRTNSIRAVCLFRRNLQSEVQIRALTTQLRQIMGVFALIAIDQEGGAVIRATSLPHAPSAFCLAQAENPILSYQVARAVARGIASLGFNWNFAPVLDVNNNPQNPVIAERAFGQSTDSVVTHGGAWLRGSLDEGVNACVKHFPGHGDTQIDSHFDLPVVYKNFAQLYEMELFPFKNLCRYAPAIMTAHICYPSWDDQYPATLSKQIIGDYLRNDLSFNGVVVTDSLAMTAISNRYGFADASVVALNAGVDLVMVLGSLLEQQAVVNAIDDGISTKKLNLLQLTKSKDRLENLAKKCPSEMRPYSQTQRDRDEQLMIESWRSGLSFFRSPLTSVDFANESRIGNAISHDKEKGEFFLEKLRSEVTHSTDKYEYSDMPVIVYAAREVQTNGVNEAGLNQTALECLFDGFNVQWVWQDVFDSVDTHTVGKIENISTKSHFSILVTCQKKRQKNPKNVVQSGIDLHLALWNPYSVLDVPADAVVSFGFGAGALVAIRELLLQQLPNWYTLKMQGSRKDILEVPDADVKNGIQGLKVWHPDS